MNLVKYRIILSLPGRNKYASTASPKFKSCWFEIDNSRSADLRSAGQLAYKDAASPYTRLALFRFRKGVTIVNWGMSMRDSGATMGRRLDSQNFWTWIGGASVLLFMFVGNTESTGLFFILAIIPAAVSIFFAFLLLKVVLRFVSNASYDLIGNLRANLRANEFLRNGDQTRFHARRLYHANPRST